jgi:hypothetical protein
LERSSKIEADVAAALGAYDKYIYRKDASQGSARYWWFPSNPKYYDLSGAMSALKQQTWLVAQYKNEIRNGDLVYLWDRPSTLAIMHWIILY